MKPRLSSRLLGSLVLLAMMQIGEAQPIPTGPETPAELAAIADLQDWAATLAANGPAGRPLPVAGHWNRGPDFNRLLDRAESGPLPTVPLWQDGWSPSYMAGLIRQGHRVLISFPDTTNATLAYFESVNDTARVDQLFDYIYRPALEYARTHRLPIAFLGWNWEDAPATSGPVNGPGTGWMLLGGTTVTGTDGSGNPIYTQQVDPLGPVSLWQNWGTHWMSTQTMQRIQAIYPDPPLVVFLNNNESGMLHEVSELGSNADRFNAAHPGVTSPAARAAIIRQGHTERISAMLTHARAALANDTWRANARYIAYNAWANAVMGRGDFYPVADGTDLWFDPAATPGRAFAQPLLYDGAMPEFYDNQWQGEKTDYGSWSPQVESFNLASIRDTIFTERPNYYFGAIAWEGGRADIPFNKVNGYITGGYGREAQRWDAQRYEGMHQFGLWAMRPRDYREFRGTEPIDGYNAATWQALLNSTERVWRTPALREYWRFGELVPNTAAAATLNGHYFDNNAAWPAWLKSTARWFLLTSSANPAESTWDRNQNNSPSIKLRVLALALRLGSAPDRRWLIYAHAPLGAVAGSTVTVPGYPAAVPLDYVPQSGSFFELRESDGSVTALHRGGPAELAVTTSKRRVVANEVFTVTAAVTHPLSEPFTSFVWSTGEGTDFTQTALTNRSLSLSTPGEHLITLTASTAAGATVSGQAVVFVGEAPATSVAYDVSFDRALGWQGLWSANGTAAVPYRLMPNASVSGLDAIEVPALGGAFVNDATRGGVFQLSAPGDGVTLQTTDRTTYLANGHTDLTISFWFRADSLTGTQGLFAQGYGGGDGGGGFNVYLSGDRLYAGTWSMTGRPAASSSVPAEAAAWSGHWLSTESGRITAGQWHQVSLVLRDATDLVAADKLFLYVDESLIAQGPAVRVKRHWTPQRLGFLGDTRLHIGPSDERAQFYGRLDAFRYVTASPEPPDLSRLVHAVNAAGPAVLGASGISYAADFGFTGGAVRAVSATAPITGGEDPDVYRSARQGTSFSYALPVANGSYRVVLKFAELDHLSAGLRRFGVSAEGQPRLGDLDLFALAGYGGGYDAEFAVTVNDGTLDLAFTASIGEASVCAIQVWDTSIHETTQTLFAADSVPATAGADGVAYELGLRFRTSTAGEVRAIRYYRPDGETGIHTGRLWGPDGTLLASVEFTNEFALGWQQASLATPVSLAVNQLYTVSVNANVSYAYTAQGMAADRVSGPLTAPGGGSNGVYALPPGSLPGSVFLAGMPNYHRDVVFASAPVLTPLQQWRQTYF